MKVAIGFWCAAGKPLMADIHGTPLLQLTVRRAIIPGSEYRLLIPWDPDLDYIEHEVKTWRPNYPHARCPLEKLLAMRDLVASMGADVGVLIDGECGAIDKAEVLLAARRVSGNWDNYKNARIWAEKAEGWLQAADISEWRKPKTAGELRDFFTPATLGMDSRAIQARREIRGSREPES